MTDRLREGPLDPARALEAVLEAGPATCVFAGTVREENRGRAVVSLTYEAHRPLAERVLRELEEEAAAGETIRLCRVLHRVGTLEVGEVSVIVAVAADDEETAAEAAGRTMDELKRRLPVWKEERYDDGERRYLDGEPLRPDPGSEGPGDADGPTGSSGPEGSPEPEAPEGGST